MSSLPPSGYSIMPLSILRTVPELFDGERFSSNAAVAMKLWRGAAATTLACMPPICVTSWR